MSVVEDLMVDRLVVDLVVDGLVVDMMVDGLVVVVDGLVKGVVELGQRVVR